jgi:ATP-dependent protease HslVU (ClpYQ) peptidase subunit
MGPDEEEEEERGTMTTIACDGKNVAADGRTTVGPELVWNDRAKIVVRPTFIAAFCGLAAGKLVLPQWIENGADPTQYPPGLHDNCTIWLYRKGAKTPEVQSGNVPYFTPIPWVHAFGTGREYAMGAMAMGASAADAVRVAVRWDLNSGGRVTSINIREHFRKRKG